MAEQSHSSEASTSFLKSLSFLFILMQLLTLVLIGAFFKTGYFSVESNKQSLAFRNGRLLGEKGQQTFDSGEAYWIWPQPIGSTISLPSRETFLSLDNKSFFYDDRPLAPLSAYQQMLKANCSAIIGFEYLGQQKTSARFSRGAC